MQETANIIKEADDRSLISLYYAQLALNATSSPTTDEQLEMMIRWSSDEIATMCNRVFARETLAETFSDFQTDSIPRIWLSHYPVVEIESVVEDGVELVPEVDYEVSLREGRLFRLNTDRSWSEPVTVTYTGGYALPFEAPEALQQAAVLMTREAYYASLRGDQSIRMVSHKESRVIYFDPNAKTASIGGGGTSPARRASEALLKKFTRFFV